MTIILGKKRSARYGALKTLDFATTHCPAACARFLDHNGLKLLFAVFMGKVRRRSAMWPGQHDVLQYGYCWTCEYCVAECVREQGECALSNVVGTAQNVDRGYETWLCSHWASQATTAC